TPDGRSIQALGIVPDVVLRAEEGGDDGRPAGYTEADLPGHLGAEVSDDGDGEALPGINAGEVLEGEGHVTAALAELKKLVAGASPDADAGAGANDDADADADAAPVEG